MNELLHSYENGQTLVSIYSDGTKVRNTFRGTQPEFPESIDVKITNWCDAGCHYCHENSTTRGLHGDLETTINLLKQLPAGVEIAIGGGHPLAHPMFDEFVTELSNHGIICNVTINEVHFSKERERLERLIADKKIYGVGYSYSKTACEWDYPHLVNHVIIGVTPYSELQNIIKGSDKILLLGYKHHTGRGVSFFSKKPDFVESNISSWYRNLFSACRDAHLSFDNLAIKQLNPARLFADNTKYDQMFMGEDGAYTMYIDAVTKTFAQSSTNPNKMQFTNSIREMFSYV